MAPTFFERPILNSPYERPTRHWELDAAGQPTGSIGGRIAVKVINHLGDEVMKVFRV